MEWPYFKTPNISSPLTFLFVTMSKTYEVSGNTTEWDDILISKGITTKEDVLLAKGLNPADVLNCLPLVLFIFSYLVFLVHEER
jgi:isopentenyl diphosphate isomerase/L-lactate dehydrogenase-like FMN-dependent dehydrogenase